MKRLRRDDYVNSHFKKPSAPSREPGNIGGSAGEVGGGGVEGDDDGAVQKLNTNDMLSYLKEVKDMFEFDGKRETYDMFLDLMKDYNAQRIDTTGVIAKVKELFRGHNNLIIGFNTFLPKGYEITVSEEEDAPVKFEEAIDFVNKIKTCFRDDDHVYKSFLDILNMYWKEHRSIDDVYNEVAALFREHKELLDEFIKFLPDASAVASEHNATLGRQQLHIYEERSSSMLTSRGTHMDKQHFRWDRMVAPHTECSPSVVHPDIDDGKLVIKLHTGQKKRGEKDNRDRSNRDKDYRATNHDMHRLAEKQKSARKVDKLAGNSVLARYDDNALKSLYKLCDKVQERLQNADVYRSFLKCLHIFSNGIISKTELQGLVADLLGKYPDLMEGFKDFLEHCDQVDGLLHGMMSNKYVWNDERALKASKIEDKDKEQRCDPNAAKEKNRFREEYWGKSIQELDLSNCQHCSPSYRLLPEDVPVSFFFYMSKINSFILSGSYFMSKTPIAISNTISKREIGDRCASLE